MFSIFSRNKEASISWNEIKGKGQLKEIIKESANQPVLLFKHSTSCAISAMAKNRLESAFDPSSRIKPYYLDLLQNREISNEISEQFGIRHESPQALLIKNGSVVYHASHNSINFKEMKEFAIN